MNGLSFTDVCAKLDPKKDFLITELEVLTLVAQRPLHFVTDAIMASVLVPALVLELRFVTHERKTNQRQPIEMVD